MPKLENAERREAKQNKARQGMRVSGRSIKTVMLPVIVKRGKEAREQRER